jgi:streptomycin 6-kinase
MNLVPFEFANRMIEMSGEAARMWLIGLPDMLDEYARRWSLTLGPPITLPYNYVAPVIREDGTEAVLKLGLPNRELLSEMFALQVFAGQGMVGLLEADFERQVFLLERIRPGVALVTLEDDDQRTRVATQVMQQLWVPVTRDYPLLTVESWTAGLRKLRSHFNDTTGPFPESLVAVAENIMAEFIPSQGERLLLHGDLHHWNILSATRQPWLAIDPKGVIGEREYEVGALLLNPDLDHLNRADLKRLQARRVAILTEMLGFDRQRILGWGVAQAFLSAWWSVEDHDPFWEPAILCGAVLYELMLTG